MTAKKWIKASALVFVFVIGCYLSYWRGWGTGNWEGFNRGDIACIEHPAHEVKPQHHYEFKQHGASLFRLDSDTGEACYIQISVADSNGGMRPCSQQ